MQKSQLNDLLFDDHAMVGEAYGHERLTFKSVNANCDCGSYYPSENETIAHPEESAGASIPQD
jgi:hypothetical protein